MKPKLYACIKRKHAFSCIKEYVDSHFYLPKVIVTEVHLFKTKKRHDCCFATFTIFVHTCRYYWNIKISYN